MKVSSCKEVTVYGIICAVFVVGSWAACDALPSVIAALAGAR